jgi:hypothetical protein
MAISFKFFHDANLTSEITSGNPITCTQNELGSLDPTQKQVWFGSTATGTQAQVDADPGVDSIVIDVVDANAGTGQPDTAVKLATSQGGLASATAGASLDTGATAVQSGTANAYTFWIEIDPSVLTAGTYTDLSLATQTLREVAGD